MSIHVWFRLPRVRRGLAVSLVVLSTGGLVLARTPPGAGAHVAPETHIALAGGSNAATFRGPGVSGRVALSHTKLLAQGEQRMFVEVDLKADAAEKRVERAPLSMAVVLDTSGSMGGEKIEQAKQSVIRLIREMRDDDEIAFVRYSSDAELIQPLARVGAVREALIARVARLSADGGTNIPPALSQAVAALSAASGGRVKRVVLASDGLDSSRKQAETVARMASVQGLTISSMGIGLDFDESYMGGVAVAGHGNFAFVKDASTLAIFLHKELTETAATVAQNVVARIALPAGVRFVRAIGADGHVDASHELVLSAGSMFAGDERRVVVELTASVPNGQPRAFEGAVSWMGVAGDTATARFGALSVSGTDDALAVEQGRDGAVIANAVSVLASVRQIEAAEASARGDGERAQKLVDMNNAELGAAASAAPAPVATALAAQAASYAKAKKAFAKPRSAEGNAAAKAGAAQDFNNLGRKATF